MADRYAAARNCEWAGCENPAHAAVEFGGYREAMAERYPGKATPKPFVTYCEVHTREAQRMFRLARVIPTANRERIYA